MTSLVLTRDSCSERIEPGEHVHRCQERDCDKTYRYCDTCQSKFGKKHPHSTYRTLRTFTNGEG